MTVPSANPSGRHYEPVADIAKGGMGRVELVVRREKSFARIYAMKRLHPDLANDPEVRAMFLEEARIAGLVRHPNVVPVLDVGEDDLGPYLVMEYVEGVPAYAPLVRARDRGERLPIGLCAEIARQAAHGLAAAHELEGAGGRKLSVVHRDVSPQNVLLGFDGLVRLTDFGVARALDRRPAEEGVLIGKLGYMSPEQLAREPLDPRSDLFSLGIVLYELLVGGRLYGGPAETATKRVRDEPPPDVRAARPDVPEALAELTRELLAKHPSERPASARQVAERLDAIVAELRARGQAESLGPFLLASFDAERKAQRALLAAALEQTHAELPLEERAAQRVTLGAAGTSESETVRLAPTPQPAAVSAPAPSAPTGRSPRAMLAITIGAAALLLVVIVAVVTRGESAPVATASSPAPPSPSPRCEDDLGCRSAGSSHFCDRVSGRCESVLSPVCPEIFPADAAQDPDAILIGTIFDRSSPNQIARERAARLAVAGLDDAGGIDGRRVALVHCDSSLGGAVAAADQLVRAHIEAIIGPSTSAEAEAVFSEHAADGVLVISPSATATQLGELDRTVPGLLWRTAPPDSLQAAVLVRDLLGAPAAHRVVVIRRGSDVYAQSLSVLVQEGSAEAGLEVGASQVFGNAEAIPVAASAALSTHPDAVVFVSSQLTDAAAFLDATASLSGYDQTTIHLTDVAANDDLLALTTTGARRFSQIRATRPAPPSTIITTEFASEYAAANGGENPLAHSFTAHTYDATALTLLGIGYALGAGELTGVRVAEGMRLVSAGTHEQRLLGSNLPGIIAALRSPTPDVDVVGASGPLDFDPVTEELTHATYQVLEVRGTPPRFEVLRTVQVPD